MKVRRPDLAQVVLVGVTATHFEEILAPEDVDGSILLPQVVLAADKVALRLPLELQGMVPVGRSKATWPGSGSDETASKKRITLPTIERSRCG